MARSDTGQVLRSTRKGDQFWVFDVRQDQSPYLRQQLWLEDAFACIFD
jgi:hypothetical protein